MVVHGFNELILHVKSLEQWKAPKQCSVSMYIIVVVILLPLCLQPKHSSPPDSAFLSSNTQEGKGIEREGLLTFFPEFKPFLATPKGLKIFHFLPRTCQLRLWFQMCIHLNKNTLNQKSFRYPMVLVIEEFSPAIEKIIVIFLVALFLLSQHHQKQKYCHPSQKIGSRF